MERNRGLMRLVSPTPALDHIKHLRKLGFNDESIAEAAGVNKSTIGNIRRGRSKQIYRYVSDKIMAVPPEAVYERQKRKGFVPAIGAVRRLQALMTQGWRYQDLTPRLGFDAATVAKNAGGWVTPRKHEAVARLYEQLWNQEGPGDMGYRKRCQTMGFAPPMAWDDDNIDNPAAKPDGIREAA
jgi:hypothetical protein